MKHLVIATGRYFAKAQILESGLMPVGVTVGAPRFSLGFKLGGNVGMLAPYRLRQIEDRDEFEAAYRARLDRFGPEKIARRCTRSRTATTRPASSSYASRT